MTDPLQHLAANKRAFVRAVARYAKEHKLSPADAMRCFGVMLRMFAEHPVEQSGDLSEANFEKAAQAAFALLAEGFAASTDVATPEGMH